jgi:hypothetical protein
MALKIPGLFGFLLKVTYYSLIRAFIRLNLRKFK